MLLLEDRRIVSAVLIDTSWGGAVVGVRLFLALALVPFEGFCGEIAQMGPNQYSVSKTSGACGMGNTGTIKAKLYKQIGEFCSKKSLSFEVTTIQEQDGIIGVRCAKATVEFRCVTEAAVSTAATGRSPDRDVNHSPYAPADRGQLGANNTTPTPQTANERYEALAKLKALLDSGAITQDEYNTEKARLLKEQ